MDAEVKSQWVEDFEGQEVPETLLAGGEGGWVDVVGGGRAYEAVSGHSCLNLGHAHPELVDAAQSALKTLSYCSPEHMSPYSIELSERLSSLLGGNFMVKYALSGASANEVALGIARRRWAALGCPEKSICLSLDRSYHGNLGQAQFVTGFEAFRVEGGRDNPDFVHISSARDAETGETLYLDQLRTKLEEDITRIGAGRIACLFVEPVNFAGGVIVPPEGYLSLLRELCDKNNITLIVDEVITGFGRMGTWFGFQADGIRPDIVTMGKGITAGYFPLAAVAVDRHLYDDLRKHKVPLKMVITMAGHPVGCGIALKALEIVERDELMGRVLFNGTKILSGLSSIISNPIVREVRGVGHMWGVEFRDASVFSAAEVASQVARHCEENGCIVAASDGIIRINPPLNMSDEERNEMLDSILSSVIKVASQLVN